MTFRGVVEAVSVQGGAKTRDSVGHGGHVVKCGLADVFVRSYAARMDRLDLSRMNGVASIHDFEIAIAGQTSEDVEAVLPDGRFGAAEETNVAGNEHFVITDGARDGLGMGEALGRASGKLAKPESSRRTAS